MSYIKANGRLLIILLFTITISGASYYRLSILPLQQKKIQLLKDENENKKKEIKYLEEKVQYLPEIEKELNNLKMDTRVLKNKIPYHQMTIIIKLEILQYMDAYGFQDTQVLVGEPISEESISKDAITYNTIPMTIKYTAPYDDAVKLVEEISRSDYMMKIERFSVDNRIQEVNDAENNNVVPGDMVKVEMLLSLYYVDDDKTEIYPNFLEFSNKAENVFSRQGKER